jgi:hypothetical protein
VKVDMRSAAVVETPAAPARWRRKPLTSVLQARITSSEHEILEQLAQRQGITLSEAVRLGAWSYLLARDAGVAPSPE